VNWPVPSFSDEDGAILFPSIDVEDFDQLEHFLLLFYDAFSVSHCMISIQGWLAKLGKCLDGSFHGLMNLIYIGIYQDWLRHTTLSAQLGRQCICRDSSGAPPWYKCVCYRYVSLLGWLCLLVKVSFKLGTPKDAESLDFGDSRCKISGEWNAVWY
jgi:hypothetical protein